MFPSDLTEVTRRAGGIEVYYGILWCIMVYSSIFTIRDLQNQIGTEFGFI